MAFSHKPLHKQVILITGATSGIGLATVKKAVQEGARVFMVARNEDELQKIQDEMRINHCETAYLAADVAEFDQLNTAADNCLTTFGRIDTWVNNAGISIFGNTLDTANEEARRLFDTNFWDTVNGCKVAVPLMKEHGGSIINVGSVLGTSVDPLQGMYTACEHALKGFTDALREEFKSTGVPVSLSLMVPGNVNTPLLNMPEAKWVRWARYCPSPLLKKWHRPFSSAPRIQ